MSNYNQIIEILISKYKRMNTPLEICFRELVNDFHNSDRVTHLIHSYPAKLLMHIPYLFLNNDVYSKKGDIVLDPFCGSGTVLLESLISGKNALGIDSNPLARLITTVKTTKYNIDKLNKLSREIQNNISGIKYFQYPDVVNIDYWFLPHIKKQLAILKTAIDRIESSKYRNFFLVNFSSCIKKVSLADPRVIVPVRLKNKNYPRSSTYFGLVEKRKAYLTKLDVYDLFFSTVNENIKRSSDFGNVVKGKFKAKIIKNNIFELEENNKENGILGVDLVITSPPYVGAQKYIRSCSLSLGWLGMAERNELKLLDSKTIGREYYRKNQYDELLETGIVDADKIIKCIYNENKLRAYIAANYLIEMKKAFTLIVNALKRNGYFILVIGNNHVCGREFETKKFLEEILYDCGLKTELQLIDDIHSYGLMTKRNKTANIISREWIVILKKAS